MTRTVTTLVSILLLATAVAQAGTDELVKKALASSPAVAAKRLQLDRARQVARALSSPANLELELAPGVGFTNSNFVLGQSIDLSGVRAARAMRARSEIEIAEAELLEVQAGVVARVLTAYAGVLAAREDVVSAGKGLETAEATLTAIRKRLEIGEAPAVHVTRAEIEVQRARQLQLASENDLDNARATLASLMGVEPDPDWPSQVAWPAIDSADPLVAGASDNLPRARMARAAVESEHASELEARRRVLPSLFAGFTADTWSLDRRPGLRDQVGFQLRIAFPIDLGEQRHTIKAARSARGAKEAELQEIVRELALEIHVAQKGLVTARSIAEGYASGIVPKAEQMVKAMQAGLESGLTSFVEVLEAQRTLIQLKREATLAAKNVRLAEVRLRVATAQLPGMETK